MSDIAEAMLAATKPVRHGVNNLMMVVLGNLDLVLRGAPEGSAIARQAGRSREAADRLGAVLAGYLSLPRDPGIAAVKAGVALRGLLPLLETAAGRAVRVDDEALPVVLWPRPEAPLALLAWALEVAGPDIVPVLHLAPHPAGGAGLAPRPAPQQSAPAFAAAAAACGGSWDGSVLVLPLAP